MNKKFKLHGDQIRNLIEPMGGCYASDEIVVEGKKVGYMCRSEPEGECHSGWTFMSGEETQEYADEPSHWGLYEVNTIANCDPEIIPFLNSPLNSAFSRDPKSGKFVEEVFQQPDE